MMFLLFSMKGDNVFACTCAFVNCFDFEGNSLPDGCYSYLK